MVLPIRVVRGYEPVDALQREFDGLVNRFFGAPQPQQSPGNQQLGAYAVDVHEDADHLHVDAELPGFKKEDVEITLENQTLTIAAERKQTEARQGTPLLNERRYTRFLRSFTLPANVSDAKCEAKLSDGVLRITLDKREETKPRKISVG